VLHLGVITILPEIFAGLNFGVTGRAINQGLLKVTYYNPRDWAQNTHLQVDDKPYGGGPGMVMMYQPIHQAIVSAKKSMPDNCKVIYLSPRGKRINQNHLNSIIKNKESS
jgi:tRNA (guanine37-N1)-methyltransferase